MVRGRREGTGTCLGQVPGSLAKDAPGKGSSFCTLDLAEDLGRSFSKRHWDIAIPSPPWQ